MGVVKVIEVMAKSDKSWEDAAQNALEGAAKTVRNIHYIEITEFHAKVEDTKISEYKVKAKIAFDVEG